MQIHLEGASMKRVMVCLLTAVVAAGMAVPAFAQGQDHQATAPPLVQLLQSKGILSPEEAAQLSQASSADEANAKLAQLLVAKGLISQDDYNRMVATTEPVSSNGSGDGHMMNAVIHIPSRNASAGSTGIGGGTAPDPAAEQPAIIPAVAPLRVLPIDTPKQGGLIPDIQLGSGAKLKPYGFFKASAIKDTASSGGATFGSNDFPLPMLIGGDTGPNGDPQFHIKARSFRIGSNFEWVPKNSDVVVTAKFEADFEGDYTNVNNRNISGVRSSQLSVRLAWMRLDTHFGERPVFAEFGQDWLLVSSSLPNLFETTGLGLAMGSLYERAPMFRTGIQFGSGSLKVQPEFAIVLPVAGSGALTDEQRARFGDRVGAEGNQPAVEGRIVFQFPLSHEWKGVAPAQVIFSGHHANLAETVPFASLPTTAIVGSSGCTQVEVNCSIRDFFPRGLQTDNPQNVWTAEVQLPTPLVTFVAKYYNGDDLRFFFAGQFNDVFADLNGTTGIPVGTLPGQIPAAITTFAGRTLTFGCDGGVNSAVTGFSCPGTAIQAAAFRPVRGQGGFMEASFPLSRIFHADPEGRNAGWVLHLQYGTDRAKAEDARRSGADGLVRTDLDTASLTYKLNKWVTFVNEVSYIDTKAASTDSKVFRGLPATTAHDWRNEFGTVFTF
jgi:hypothetical protein